MSVSQFEKDNSVYFEFFPNHCFVKTQDTKEIIPNRFNQEKTFGCSFDHIRHVHRMRIYNLLYMGKEFL